MFSVFSKAQTATNRDGNTKNLIPADSGSLPVFFLRRVQFLSADGITHFRYVDTAPGHVSARDLYYKMSTRVQVNLTADGSIYVQARGESGRTFPASYDYTGIGKHEGYWSFNLKSLYLGQKIGKHLEAQAGGVEFDRGSGSEATYADNDGWLEGYRVIYSPQRKRLPDKVSATVGYVGDFAQPNVFARLNRMADEDYVQLLAQKRMGKDLDASGEFDSLQGVRYTREALRWQKLPVPIVQGLQVEALVRASGNATLGWSSNLYRDLDRKGRLRAGVFYCDVPKGMFQLSASELLINGDSYGLGKHVGPTLRLTPFKNFEVSLFGSGRLDNTPGMRYRGQVAVRYQFSGLLNHAIR